MTHGCIPQFPDSVGGLAGRLEAGTRASQVREKEMENSVEPRYDG